jgi:hypothetical protein
MQQLESHNGQDMHRQVSHFFLFTSLYSGVGFNLYAKSTAKQQYSQEKRHVEKDIYCPARPKIFFHPTSIFHKYHQRRNPM